MNTVADTANRSLPEQGSSITMDAGFLARRDLLDWVFAALVLAGGVFTFVRYAGSMDGYEKAILLGAIPAAVWLGW